jgi:hypothetical protein
MMSGRLSINEIVKRGIFAGAAGGLAEMIWVTLYAMASGGNAANLARGVTTAAGVSALLPAAPVSMGIAVHMALAVLLGVALVGLWQALAPRGSGVISLFGVMLAALACVWTMNFFVLLPVISPSFAQIIPYPVSLISKLLFGLAAAETMRRSAAEQAARMPAAVAVRASHIKAKFPSN